MRSDQPEGAPAPLRIAVVGSGGAGMAAAWLLDERHDVTLFERNAALGGHAHSTRVELDGRVHLVDDGFSWFSDAMYPTFLRWLELTGVPTRIVPMTLGFRQLRTGGETLVLPPHKLGRLLRYVAHPPTLRTLLRFNRAIACGRELVEGRERALSWADFVARHRFPEPFCSDVLTPIVTGSWGAPAERIRDFSAYTVMKYLVFHASSGIRPYSWHVIRGGAASYIDRVARQLRRAKVLAGTAVDSFERRDGRWLVRDGAGRSHEFDHVVLATGSRDARQLLRVWDGGGDEVRRVVDRFEHYTVRVATHSDPSFMPPRRDQWQVANVTADGPYARLTTWVDSLGGAEIFASYLGEREPSRCHHVSTFHLPLFTPEHYRALDALAEIQGRDGLWFAGDWTHDIGAHEDSVRSAVAVARGIDPTLPRLTKLASPRVVPPQTALPDVAPESAGAA